VRYIVKAVTSSGEPAWIKRQAGPYRIGPREQATVFVTRGDAREAIRQLPEAIRNCAEFSVEATD
jgi:hypothetical protein